MENNVTRYYHAPCKGELQELPGGHFLRCRKCDSIPLNKGDESVIRISSRVAALRGIVVEGLLTRWHHPAIEQTRRNELVSILLWKNIASHKDVAIHAVRGCFGELVGRQRGTCNCGSKEGEVLVIRENGAMDLLYDWQVPKAQVQTERRDNVGTSDITSQ